MSNGEEMGNGAGDGHRVDHVHGVDGADDGRGAHGTHGGTGDGTAFPEPWPLEAQQPLGGWDGGYDAEATGFVQLPPGGFAGLTGAYGDYGTYGAYGAPGTHAGPPGYDPQGTGGEGGWPQGAAGAPGAYADPLVDPLAAPGTGQGGYTPPPLEQPYADGDAYPVAPDVAADPGTAGQWSLPYGPAQPTGPSGPAGAAEPADPGLPGTPVHPAPFDPGPHAPVHHAPHADADHLGPAGPAEPQPGSPGAPPEGPEHGHGPGLAGAPANASAEAPTGAWDLPDTPQPGADPDAAATGQGAAAALAGSHEARTQRRPLGAGGGAQEDADIPPEDVEDGAGDADNPPSEVGQGPFHGLYGGRLDGDAVPFGAPDGPQDDPAVADAHARRQVPFEGGAEPAETGAAEQGADDAGTAGAEAPSRTDAPEGAEGGTPGGGFPGVATVRSGLPWAPSSPASSPAAPQPPDPLPDEPAAAGGPAEDAFAEGMPAGAGTETGDGVAAAPNGPDAPDTAPAPPQPPEAKSPAEAGTSEPGRPNAGEAARAEAVRGAEPEPEAEPDPQPGARSEPGAGADAEAGTSPPARSAPGEAHVGTPSAEPVPDAAPEATAEAAVLRDGGPGQEPAADGERPPAPRQATEPAGPDGWEEHQDDDEEDDGPAAAGDFGGDEHPCVSYVLRVNGVDRPVTDAWIGESLLYVLRERLGLAGAKDGCSQGECGACSVQVDGRLVASCLVPAATSAGTEIRTVEGLAADGTPSDVQRALTESGAVQCGFCVPGLAMTVQDLLAGNHAPSDLETRQAISGNLCRCSGYRGVLDAVRTVVAERSAKAAREEAEAEGETEPVRGAPWNETAGDPARGAHPMYPGQPVAPIDPAAGAPDGGLPYPHQPHIPDQHQPHTPEQAPQHDPFGQPYGYEPENGYGHGDPYPYGDPAAPGQGGPYQVPHQDTGPQPDPFSEWPAEQAPGEDANREAPWGGEQYPGESARIPHQSGPGMWGGSGQGPEGGGA